MPLSCDWAPIQDWTIPWNSVGPYVVDSWGTSIPQINAGRLFAHRVVGKYGFQLHTRDGCVIQFNRDYAEAICRAANAGELIRDSETVRL